MTQNNTIKLAILIIADLILLYAALFSGLILRYQKWPDEIFIRQHLFHFTTVFLSWLVVFGALGLYDLKFMKNGKRFLYRLLRAMAINTIIAIIIFYLIKSLEIEPRRNLFIIVFAATIFIFLWRWLFNYLVIRAPTSRLIFFGITKETLELVRWLLKNPQLGQKPIAFISNNGEIVPSDLTIQNFIFQNGNLAEIIKNTKADQIVISREFKENKAFVKMLFQAIPLGVAVVEFSSFYEMLTGRIPLSLIEEIWFIENLVGIKKNIYDFFKRTADVIIAAFLIIPAVIIFPLVGLGIKLTSAGSIFFKQKRVGRHGKEFEVMKYRSMVENAQNLSGFKGDGPDPRLTQMGSIIRKSYIDEMPQIINILRGEMSFVGPRPERPEYVRELKEKVPFYEMRLLVLPGITGWAQVNMENDASVEDAPEKMQYDLYYIKNRSFLLDVLVALRTIFIILRRPGR